MERPGEMCVSVCVRCMCLGLQAYLRHHAASADHAASANAHTRPTRQTRQLKHSSYIWPNLLVQRCGTHMMITPPPIQQSSPMLTELARLGAPRGPARSR